MPSDLTDEVYAAGLRLYEKLRTGRALVRRVGIRVTGLVARDAVYLQPTLDAPDHGWREAERAADDVIQRFGPHAVRRAVLTRRDRP